jgi:hypothetical protein
MNEEKQMAGVMNIGALHFARVIALNVQIKI